MKTIESKSETSLQNVQEQKIVELAGINRRDANYSVAVRVTRILNIGRSAKLNVRIRNSSGNVN